jgi:hypothetical protein
VSACRRNRLLGGLTAALLLLAGCGHSSSGKSAASTSTRPSTGGSTGGSSSQPGGPSTEVASGTVAGSSGGVTATLHAGTRHPKVGRPWPIRFTVTRSGSPVATSVSYQYLFAGQVVARRSHYTFTGHFSDVFKWPATAVGYPLTFRAVIVSGATTINLDYPVQVRK